MIFTNSTTNLVANLDTSFIVSIGIFAAIWLWKQRTFGYVLAIIINIKVAVYTIVLTVGCFVQGKAGIEGAYDSLGLWLFFFCGSLVSVLYLLRGSRK